MLALSVTFSVSAAPAEEGGRWPFFDWLRQLVAQVLPDSGEGGWAIDPDGRLTREGGPAIDPNGGETTDGGWAIDPNG